MTGNVASTLVLAGLLSASSLVGCSSTDSVKSSDVKPSTIYRSYGVKFDHRTLSTSMYANFRVGGITGTNVELTKPSDVSVIGDGIDLTESDKKFNSALGANYNWDVPSSNAITSVKFQWVRQDGSQVEDQLSPPAVSTVDLEKSQFSIRNGVRIRLAAPAEDSDVSIIVSSEVAESKNAYALASRLSASEYMVNSKELERFKAGKIRIDVSFTRRTSISKSEQDLGGMTSYAINMLPISADMSE